MFRLPGLIAAFCAVLFVSVLASPAHADWRRAESEHFIIYSDGSERSLRTYVEKLERFDRLLRLRFNLPLDAPVYRKLPIYLVGDFEGLRAIRPALPRGVAGFYSPATEDIFAIAIRDLDEDDVLLHEYAHHFMYQNMRGYYPGWLVEGFAEYFMTAEFRESHVTYGKYNPWRADSLMNESWPTMDEMLVRRPLEMRGERRYVYYAVAWLMTHWFMSTPERTAQLGAYVDAIRNGRDPIEALNSATGMTPAAFQAELRRYVRGSIYHMRLPQEFPEVQMQITRLPPSADALLLINQRLKVGVPDEDRAEQAVIVRRIAARFPDDVFAQVALGHAELHFGDPEEGERVLTAVLERDPAHVEALQLMATRRMAQAEDAEVPETRMRQARAFLARAYRADDANYYTLLLLARSRTTADEYPTDNDLETWRQAFEFAPQLPEIRLGMADALGRRERFADVIAVLEPLANAPHGGPAAEEAERMLEAAREGRPLLSAESIEAISEAEAEREPEAPPPEGEARPDEEAPET